MKIYVWKESQRNCKIKVDGGAIQSFDGDTIYVLGSNIRQRLSLDDQEVDITYSDICRLTPGQRQFLERGVRGISIIQSYG